MVDGPLGERASSVLATGSIAPDFTLRDQFGQDFTLSDLRGQKAVLLVFYPFAFSGVCTGELSVVRSRLAEFVTFDTEVVAISCDPVYGLRNFADSDGLNFGLLSDFWPHGQVSQQYGVFDELLGCPTRSSFVVDRDGRIAWQVHNAMGEARDFDQQLAQLRLVV